MEIRASSVKVIMPICMVNFQRYLKRFSLPPMRCALAARDGIIFSMARNNTCVTPTIFCAMRVAPTATGPKIAPAAMMNKFPENHCNNAVAVNHFEKFQCSLNAEIMLSRLNFKCGSENNAISEAYKKNKAVSNKINCASMFRK